MTGYPAELQDFVECAALGREPLSGGPLARDVLAVVYGAYLSAAEGRRVDSARTSPLNADRRPPGHQAGRAHPPVGARARPAFASRRGRMARPGARRLRGAARRVARALHHREGIHEPSVVGRDAAAGRARRPSSSSACARWSAGRPGTAPSGPSRGGRRPAGRRPHSRRPPAPALHHEGGLPRHVPVRTARGPDGRDRAHPRLVRDHGEADRRRLHARRPRRLDRGDGPDPPRRRRPPGRRRAERLRLRSLHGRPRLPLRGGGRRRRGDPDVGRLHRPAAPRPPRPRQRCSAARRPTRSTWRRRSRRRASARKTCASGSASSARSRGRRRCATRSSPPPPDGAQHLRAVGGDRPGVAVECPERRGMHVAEDHFLPEVVDPDTLEPVPPGPPASSSSRRSPSRGCPSSATGRGTSRAWIRSRAPAGARWCASGASWGGPTTC